MTQIAFTIPGHVRGKGRPKFSKQKNANFVRVYTDAATTNAEAMVRSLGAEAMRGQRPLEGPLKLSIEIFVPYPESWSKRRKVETRFVTGKPDCDNVVKLIGDALNGIVWRDDAQIAAISFVREYTHDGAEAVVTVETLPANIIAKQPSQALKATPLFREPV